MNSFWRSCLSHFEQQLPPQQFKTWIKPLKFRAVDKAVTWVTPKLVGEVRYSELTPDGHLRHPVWRGLRADKAARDVRRES